MTRNRTTIIGTECSKQLLKNNCGCIILMALLYFKAVLREKKMHKGAEKWTSTPGDVEERTYFHLLRRNPVAAEEWRRGIEDGKRELLADLRHFFTLLIGKIIKFFR